MKRALWAVPLLMIVCAEFALATYSYYYTENGASPVWSNWIVQNNNGQLAVYSNGGYSGIAFATNNAGGSGRMTYPSTSASPGEVKLTFRMATTTTPVTGTVYLSASTDLSAPGASPAGSGYKVDFWCGSIGSSYTLSKIVSGQFTVLTSGLFAPSHDLMTLRFVRNSNGLILGYMDNVRFLQYSDTTYTSGRMAVELGYATTQPATGPLLSEIDLGNPDSTAPNAVPSGSISATPFYNHVDIQWPAASDDTNGTGIYDYEIWRNGWLVGSTPTLSFADSTVAPSTAYSYTLKAVDFHGNAASTTFSVTTPAFSPEGRRVGVRPTGAYWGSSGENIDVLSGNLNFALPLVKAQARTGWGVGFNLTYNSQNWRYDANSSWKHGVDVGYGFGWRLMAGSITPMFADPYTVNYYLFTDSTGAEYRLDQSSINVYGSTIWSSKESTYVSFDATYNRLWFTNGTLWTFGCTSAPGEADSGVMYPTLMQDSNGNEIIVRYQTGTDASWTNSSARITTIEDVRAVQYNPPATYTFTYNTDSPPHLTSIGNNVNTGENYSFSYLTGQTLSSPFDSSSFGTTAVLQQVTITGNSTSYGFTYNASGELTKVLLPYQGYLAYDYTTTAYPNGLSYREVVHRYLSKDGITSTEYPISHEASPTGTIHQYTQLDDPGGVGEKYWAFAASGASAGLVTQYQGRQMPGQVPLIQNDYTWTQDTVGNNYINSVTTTADPTQSYAAAKKTAQTLDIYGNVTQVLTYDYGNLTTPIRTDNYTYIDYPWFYLFNRLTSSPTATISYDQFAMSTPPSDVHEWASWGTIYSGNPTTIVSPAGTQVLTYDFAGDVLTNTVNGLQSSVTSTNATNYSAPSQITVGSLSNSMSYSSFLGLTNETDPNGASSTIGYDAMARPTSTTSPFGATTTTSYNDTAAPYYALTTVNGRWTKTTMDGLGRTTKTETGNASGTVSVAETVYDSCGCSPLGKMVQTAIPHASGATPVWTTYSYDGIGRTLTKTTAGTDTTSTTSYVYQGNTVTVTDAMGKWKKYTMNALGQLVQVNEPNPAGGADYVTTYAYDTLGHLTSVSMPRPTGTQTRTFNYGNPPGTQLLSATNPENGTVTYTYNADNTLAEKVDAKGQHVRYTYDAYKRVTEVQRGNWGTVTNNTLTINMTSFGSAFEVVSASGSPFSDLQIPPNYDGYPENFTFTTHDNLGTSNLRVYYNNDYPNGPYGTVNSLTLNGVQYSPDSYYPTCDGYGDCYVEFATAPAGGPTTGLVEDTCQRETYTYDSGTYGLGRLTGIQYQGGRGFYPSAPYCDHTFSENFAYSQAGGITSQSFGVSEPAQNYSGGGAVGTTLTASYTYDNEGRITETQYPSSWNGFSSWVAGPNIGNTFDSMGRLQKVTDLGASSDIISNATYGPAGQLLTMTAAYTQGINETRSYNSIGQLTSISSCVAGYTTCTPTLNAQYNYSATQNNGKITSQYDALSGETVAYLYDSLNRLSSASGSGWGQSYGYDGFGNLTNQTVTSGTAPALSTTYDPTTNRQTGECADANGNLNSPTCGGAYIYDIANRIVEQNPTGGVQPTVAYSYKPGNKRIWKGTGYAYNGQGSVPANEELTFWSITGQKLETYSLTQYQPYQDAQPQLVATQTATNYYFGGRLIKNTTGYVTPDRGGSIGKYFPFGQERPSATTNGKEKFATYFRDSETGLDYASQRYHQPGMGRFMTPDRMTGKPAEPGSWNKYAYTRGDPVNRVDPNGTADFSVTGWGNPDVDWSFMQNFSFGEDSSLTPCAASLVANDPGMLANPIAIAQICGAAQQQGGGGGSYVSVKVPPGAPYTQSQMQDLTDGFDDAYQHAGSFDCANFLGGGNFNSQDAVAGALYALENTTYRLVSLPQGPGTGAQTVDSSTVFINTDGAFFGATPNANGTVTVGLPNSAGVQTAVTFENLSTFQGFLLLHELGHEMGVLGPDQDAITNGQNSGAVLDNCFTQNAQGVYY